MLQGLPPGFVKVSSPKNKEKLTQINQGAMFTRRSLSLATRKLYHHQWWLGQKATLGINECIGPVISKTSPSVLNMSILQTLRLEVVNLYESQLYT